MTWTPTVRLRRLGIELRRLREDAALTQDQAAQRLGRHRTSLVRVERAQVKSHRSLVVSLLDLYKASPAKRKELLALYENADQRGMLTTYEHALPGEYPAYISFESIALSMSNWDGQAVPGLLQTADYARAVTETGPFELSQDDLTRRVDARMDRQKLLLDGDHPLQLRVIIDEAALRRVVGSPDVMQAQIGKLAEQTKLANVTIQIIPFNVGAHAGIPGSFVVLDFPSPDAPLVYVEHAAGDLFVDEGIARFRGTFDKLEAVALGPDESLHMINSITYP